MGLEHLRNSETLRIWRYKMKSKDLIFLKDLKFYLVTILFSVFFLIFSLQLSFKTDTSFGPGFWPTIILVSMLGLGILGFVIEYRAQKAIQSETEPTAKENKVNKDYDINNKEESKKWLDSNRHWAIMGILILYFLVMEQVGLAIITPFFIFTMAKTLGAQNNYKLVSISLLFTIFVVLLFNRLLSVPLPVGTGVFRTFNRTILGM